MPEYLTTYGQIGTSANSITITPTRNDDHPRTPAGLIATQAVQTRDGWLGQVIVDKEIVWESEPHRAGGNAVEAANTRVVEAIKGLFGWTPPPAEEEPEDLPAE